MRLLGEQNICLINSMIPPKSDDNTYCSVCAEVLDLGEDTVLDREGRSFVRIRYDAELYLEIAARLHADVNCIPVAAR